jgi:hypothetical protein
MKRRVAILLVLGVVISLFGAGSTVSALDKEKAGLAVSPVRQEDAVTPGKPTTGFFSVANYTQADMTISLTVKEYSTADYNYDYQFRDTDKDWIKLETQQVTLEPGEDKEIYYAISAPETAAPGGHYFAFFASAEMPGGAVKRTAQVVSLLNLNVHGDLKHAGSVENGKVPFLVYDDKITYIFDARNTGNTHYNAYFYAKLDGFLYSGDETGVTHVLMPDTVRRVGGSVRSPFWPGLYTLTYGFKTDFDTTHRTFTTQILYIPLWSVAALIAVILGASWLWKRRKQS